MSNVNAVTFTIVVVLFLVVTLTGFAAARWRRAEDMLHLNEWGLGGRSFGTFVAWFLLGGDLYTAYTFIAVPAAVFGAGAVRGEHVLDVRRLPLLGKGDGLLGVQFLGAPGPGLRPGFPLSPWPGRHLGRPGIILASLRPRVPCG